MNEPMDKLERALKLTLTQNGHDIEFVIDLAIFDEPGMTDEKKRDFVWGEIQGLFQVAAL